MNSFCHYSTGNGYTFCRARLYDTLWSIDDYIFRRVEGLGEMETKLHLLFTGSLQMLQTRILKIPVMLKCDLIWENALYGIRAQFVPYTLLVAKVEICRSPDFVICDRLWENTPYVMFCES